MREGYTSNGYKDNHGLKTGPIGLKTGHIGIRTGHTASILASVKEYLKQHPADYQGQVESLLEMIYTHYTEYNSVETPELKAGIKKVEEELRSLVDTEDEREQYMNAIYHMCAIYERTAYIEGMKVGMRIVIEGLEEL